MEGRFKAVFGPLWRHQWAVVGAMGLTAFVAGLVGLRRLLVESGNPDAWSWTEAIYFSLRLFGLNFDLGGDGPDPYAAGNWQLWVASFLAPATTALAAIKVVAISAARRFELWKISRFKGHAIVCGAGERGRRLALSLRGEHRQVVVIEKDEGCDTLGDLRAEGVEVIVGSATDPTTQDAARLDTAAIVVAMTPCPEANLRVVLAADRRAGRMPLKAFACAPRAFAAMFEEQEPFSRIENAKECGFFDSNALSARALVKKHAPDIAVRLFRERRSARILVAGDGEVVPELLGVLFAQCQYACSEGPRVTVLTVGKDSVARGFPLQHPQLRLVGDLQVRSMSLVRMMTVEMPALDRKCVGGDADLIFAVCREDADTLALATHLARQAGPECRVVAGLAPSTSLHRLLGEKSEWPDVAVENLVNLACDADSVLRQSLDEQAMKIHREYLESQSRASTRTGSRLSLRPWGQLREDFRQGNRSQADHGLIKRRILEESATPETKELLAEAEHRRWMADRIFCGWRYGAARDDLRLLHDCIRPYCELPENNKDNDRAAVKKVSDSLGSAGTSGGRPAGQG